MSLILVPAAALTLATLLLALAWRLVLALRRRPAPRYVRRTLLWHALLFVVHAFVTVPVGLGIAGARIMVQTRGDERGWRGPRIDADGKWLLQSRDTLWAERHDEQARTALDPALDVAAGMLAVSFTARDGVKLRGFLVPPWGERAGDPRFVAVLVHGLYRGGLELETVASMFRDLGGLVLLVELRNHGGSDRARPTYGRDEALDVLAAVELVRARPEAAGRPLVLFAVSLGTAAAALAAPQIPDLGGLILDAPIDDLRATADRMLRAAGSGRRGLGMRQPFRGLVLAAAGLFGVPFDEVRPIETLQRLDPTVPVLLIGAGHDDRSPPDRVRALFDALPTLPDRKELWLVPDADHGKVWLTAHAAYRTHLTTFLHHL